MPTNKIVDAVNALALAYPRAEFPEASQDLYIQMLSDLDPELVMQAVQDRIGQQPFPPAISEIRAAVAKFHAEAAGRMSASEAWGKVHQQMIRVGRDRRPDLDEITMRAVEAIGGWYFLCTSLEEDMPSHRARFATAYNTFLDRESEQSVRLPGVKQLIERMTAKRLGNGTP